MIVIPASLRSDFIHMAGMTIHIALESTIHIVGIRNLALGAGGQQEFGRNSGQQRDEASSMFKKTRIGTSGSYLTLRTQLPRSGRCEVMAA